MEGTPENRQIADDEEPFVRSFEEFRKHGLLWLINRAVFHPRGFALALHYPPGASREEIIAGHVEPIGWGVEGDGEEPWFFWNTEHRRVAIEAGADPEKLPPFPGDEDDAFRRFEILLSSVRKEGL